MYEEIEDSWTVDSGDYDDIIQKQLSNRRDVEHWEKELEEILGEKPLRILDIGCGPGFLTVILSRLGHSVKAIDGSAGMVEKAADNIRKKGVSACVIREDAVTLPDEKNSSYDVLISRDVIWTLYNPEKAFLRWKEVLKPGGRLIYYDGAFLDYKMSRRLRIWKKAAAGLIYLTEHKKYREDVDRPVGAFENLPFFGADRPLTDCSILKNCGFNSIHVSDDEFRNSPFQLDYWKYGYMGRYFRIIATREEEKETTSFIN